MEIFGKEIQIKKQGCNVMGELGKPIPPSVNLFVKVTKRCNARCLFCSNANCQDPEGEFNVEKLFEIIDEIQQKDILVNRVNITGGEPSVVPHLVVDILERARQNRYGNIHFHLNTNGLLLQSQQLMKHGRWNSISMSLHHYDVNALSELYGTRISEDAFELSGIDKRKLNVSCNLIKGYIDSDEEVHRMLDYILSLGIYRIGFVALMKVNDYCKERFIDLNEIHLSDIPHVYYTKSMDRGADCKCSNFLYNKGLDILEIYMRNYMNPNYCESSLVYDGTFLRQGFYQDNIVY